MSVVVVSSILYGDTFGVVREITPATMLVDMVYTPPIGSLMSLKIVYVGEDHRTIFVFSGVVTRHRYDLVGPHDSPRIEFEIEPVRPTIDDPGVPADRAH